MIRKCKMNISKGSKKVVLELLSFCNLKCRHCFYRNLEISSDEFLSKEDFLVLIDKFKENKIDKLVLTGGEPTLHPNFIEISECAIKNISRVSLCTNGVIINKKLRDKIIKLDFSNYTVSIDSHINNIHDDFRGMSGALAETISFCGELKKNGKNLSIHITLHQNNIDHIDETIEYCKQFDCEIVVGTIYFDEVYLKKIDYEEVVSTEYKKKINDFKDKYLNDKGVTIVGFEEYCKNKRCPDQKRVFMVNRKGELISCYWKKNGGKFIRKY